MPGSDNTAKSGKRKSKLLEAVEWLRETLESYGREGGVGPYVAVPVNALRAQAEASGHTWSTVQRARRISGVEARYLGPSRERNGVAFWEWKLPGPILSHQIDECVYQLLNSEDPTQIRMAAERLGFVSSYTAQVFDELDRIAKHHGLTVDDILRYLHQFD